MVTLLAVDSSVLFSLKRNQFTDNFCSLYHIFQNVLLLYYNIVIILLVLQMGCFYQF